MRPAITYKVFHLYTISLCTAVLLLSLGSECFAKDEPKGKILNYGLSAISSDDKDSANLFKNRLLKEAREGKFTGPSHSRKITQALAMFRGYYYLEVKTRYPDLFSDDEHDIIENWFIKITERAFTVEWSDIYYALAFRKPVTAPYRNQENGAGALVVYAKIIKNKRPDLAKKAVDYVKNNAVMWNRNFRNTDDSTSYQALWIYNCYNVARLLYPEWLNNEFSKRSFDWLKNQWPPDGSPLGYNPNPEVLVPDIMYLGAHLHRDGTYKWLGNRMMEYASKHNKELSGFRPGLVFKNVEVAPQKPTVGSLYIQGPGNLVQFPSENKPDKIVFREGWERDDFYALLNLRFDGWHGYKGTNAFVSIRYGEPFVVEDLVKKSWDWLPKGRAKRRDENICRSRLNGFQLGGGLLRKIINTAFGFENSWEQDVPKFAQVEDFTTSKKIDYSRTTLSGWRDWDNTRICLLVKDDYFIVFDFNDGKNKRKHAIAWHLRGELSRKGNQLGLKQANHELSLFLCADNADFIIKSSSEPYPPQSTDFAAEHDVLMKTLSDHSEIISLFSPHRKSPITSVQKITDSSPHITILKIVAADYQDVVIIKDSDSNEKITYGKFQFDSEAVVLRKRNEAITIYYKGGKFITYHGKKIEIKDQAGKVVIKALFDQKISK